MKLALQILTHGLFVSIIVAAQLSGCKHDNSTAQPLETSSIEKCLINGVNFSPYVDGQDPNQGVNLSPQQIETRLAQISPYLREDGPSLIRGFGSGNGLFHICAASKALNHKVAMSAWLDGNEVTNNEEIDLLISNSQQCEPDILIVGSEVLLRGDITKIQLLSYINKIKKAFPATTVTTADVYSVWLNNPDLVDQVDVVFANYYPYWEGIALEESIGALHVYHEQVIKIAQNKPVYVSETGWPSGGDPIRNAVPSPENAGLYFQGFLAWAETLNVEYLYFEAFDEKWKTQHEGPQGAAWGILNSNGTLKAHMKGGFGCERPPDNWSEYGDIPGGTGGTPVIEAVRIPDYGTYDNFIGKIKYASISDYRIATYIKVSGRWWVKPYANKKLTNIAFDGSFEVDVTTGGFDRLATEIALFLVPKAFDPPTHLGSQSLSQALYDNAITEFIITR